MNAACYLHSLQSSLNIDKVTIERSINSVAPTIYRYDLPRIYEELLSLSYPDERVTKVKIFCPHYIGTYDINNIPRLPLSSLVNRVTIELVINVSSGQEALPLKTSFLSIIDSDIRQSFTSYMLSGKKLHDTQHGLVYCNGEVGLKE